MCRDVYPTHCPTLIGASSVTGGHALTGCHGLDLLQYTSLSCNTLHSLTPPCTSGPTTGSTSKRSRNGSPVQPDTAELQIIVQKQAAEIDALQKEKKTTEESMQSLKSEHERTVKENHVLRRAVQIQSDRQNETDKELKEAHKYKVDAEERIKKLEHMIVALRYHLQAQQAPVANDFLNQRPPDVY